MQSTEQDTQDQIANCTVCGTELLVGDCVEYEGEYYCAEHQP